MTNQLTEQTPAFRFFKKEGNEFLFLNVLAKAHYKLADLGELLAIRDLIIEEDSSSFVNAYLEFADNCRTIADDCLQKGHTISARDAYLRASTYYYAAMDYLDEAGQPEQFLPLFKQHRACWKSAAMLMDFNYEEFSIPYEGTTLSGFFMGHKDNGSPKPLCIFNNGSDGSILECWTAGGAGRCERGYNLVTFDGPGQGSSLFEKQLYFRHDWEKVITPVVDSIINRKEVDRNNIILFGVSQAGYWVPRAAAFEHRLKAIVIDPGVTDVSTSWFSNLPPELLSVFKSADRTLFNQYMQEGFKASPEFSALYNFRARPYGTDNPFDTFSEVKKYNLAGIADKINCNVIITSPENEVFWPGQSEELYNMIEAPKQLINFTKEQGANFHCEPKARVFWEQQVLDRLDEIVHG